MEGSVSSKCGKMCSIATNLGHVTKEHKMHMKFQFGGYNLIFENTIYQKIGILGLVLIQAALRIVLKNDQPPIALAHTLYNKEC
jgi:hypothetical protein